MVAIGHVKDEKVTKKKTKAVSDVLAGKRVLDLANASCLLPPKSFFHETTDGFRLRIFLRAADVVYIWTAANGAWCTYTEMLDAGVGIT